VADARLVVLATWPSDSHWLNAINSSDWNTLKPLFYNTHTPIYIYIHVYLWSFMWVHLSIVSQQDIDSKKTEHGGFDWFFIMFYCG
jgi:hypothetical protein